MSEQDLAAIVDHIDSKFNLLLDKVKHASLEKYTNSTKIIEHFDIDKPTFHKFIKEGMPVKLIGRRWKGKISEIEKWFVQRNHIHLK